MNNQEILKILQDEKDRIDYDWGHGVGQVIVDKFESLARCVNDAELLAFLCESGYHCVPIGPKRWGLFNRKWELIEEGIDYRHLIAQAIKQEQREEQLSECAF